MSEVVLLAVSKITSVLAEEATMAAIAKLSEKVTGLKELPSKVMNIKQELSVMNNVIRKIGSHHDFKDEVVNSWISEVCNIAYHVQDVMDKCSYHVLQINEEGFLKQVFKKGTRNVKVFREIADEVFEVQNEIQQVRKMGQQLLSRCFHVGTNIKFVKEDLVGIRDNRILLTGWLYSEEPEGTVITVSRMGGLGKSTLATNVYKREKINFPAHAWIVVSQIYTVDALLRKLLWKIGYTEQPLSAGIDKMDVHDLKKEIQPRLQNKIYLIVLDDVWEPEVYFQIHDVFHNLQGSRIIITTRKDHVAGISSSTRHLELQPLINRDAFDLFCRRAFYNKKGHVCPSELEDIADSIVDRCRGLPLVIVTIGSMLSYRQQLDFWKQTYNQLQSELSKNGHVRAIFHQSYHDLSDHRRNCFLYCCLFPEDHFMSRDILVRLWVAEGFVLSKDKNTPEMVAEGNLMELISCNMLEVVDYDELGRVNTCKMHNIVRELAISVAKKQGFASANDYGTVIQIDRDVRRLASYGWKDDTALKVKLPRLRTVLAPGVISLYPNTLSSILSGSSYLNVLELQDSEVTEVPASIGHLFNLKYIGLRRTKVKSLPESIQKLSNLQTLDIKQTKIEKLPRGLGKITKLRHLLADRYDGEKWAESGYFIGVQSPKELSNLAELQTLETVESSNDLAEQLKKLMQLRSVCIDNISAADCANLYASKDENEALCFKDLKPRSADLHKLVIRGQWAKGTLNCPIFLSHRIYLKYLALSWCHLGEDPLEILAQHLPYLRFLKLNNMHSASTLVLTADSFPYLHTLVLEHMHDVSRLNFIDGALPCIEVLHIVSLPKLDKVPQGIESLRSLKKLWLLDLHKNFRIQRDSNEMHQKMLHVPEVRV
ncbi:hypothetical protein BRADI_4g21842v3 [Brachypodium distachyon]|uniref:NB-ARC domain-containing protein n=1 Tax=Brachypodium distachyon TaxID=15368 RepID=A0A2K2CPC4_BRADI|nr:hypothetical protein BRADI_4g21842v3 [Brachypodium distachyon]